METENFVYAEGRHAHIWIFRDLEIVIYVETYIHPDMQWTYSNTGKQQVLNHTLMH